MFWHVVLGGLLIFTAKKWEAGTMSVLALIEVFINSMILGLYFGFGDDPFRMEVIRCFCCAIRWMRLFFQMPTTST
jgi:hypothetical protein